MYKYSYRCASFILSIFFPILLVAGTGVESPFFLVKTNSSSTTSELRLPLIHTQADVNITGVIADVKVTQIYVNSGTVPIEAVYVFPGTSKSAVYGMTITIGDRVTKAEIQRKEKAKKMYEAAKKEGKSASLLQQHRPNVFQMNVANILPGDTIKVELFYNEFLVPESGEYQFVYPRVVGPRYGSDKEKWTQNEYTNKKTISKTLQTYTFDINVNLTMPLPISQADCSTHQIVKNITDEHSVLISLEGGKGHEGNRDFVLKYRQAGDKIESGIMLYEGEEENFFLMMMEPPKQVKTSDIPPREYIFIVDISGSMNGFPIEISKTLMRNLLGGLRIEDKFNLLLFAGSYDQLSKTSIEATPDNIQKAISLIEQHDGNGGTDILPPLKAALNLPYSKGLSRSVIVLTDGLVSVDKEAIDLIRNNLNRANCFAFGIGGNMNRFLIEGIAHAGQGEAFIATDEREATELAKKFQKYIASPVLTDISLTIQGFDAYDVEPLSIPDVFAERPVIVFGKYRGEPKGGITIEGQTANTYYGKALNVAARPPSKDNSALKYLWARERIRQLSDYTKLSRTDNSKLIEKITLLGLQYNLLTDYTAFVAIDKKNRSKEIKKLKDKTIKYNNNSTGAVPEPHEWLLIGLLMSMMLLLFYRRA